MSNYGHTVRQRRKTLLIVEGYNEKNTLFWLMFKVFPELDIAYENIWIYGTNIYELYQDIVKEYGETWAENYDDIDIPFVISKKQGMQQLAYKEDFSDIFLVFDYERHDPGYAADKIEELQKHFEDSTDMGKLFINYPMLESYQHFESMPDPAFENRHVSAQMHNGNEYKRIVYDTSILKDNIWFPHKIDGILEGRFHVSDDKVRSHCQNSILQLHDKGTLDKELKQILTGVISSKDEETCRHQLLSIIPKLGYISNGLSYWEYMRKTFRDIIYWNICKANKIQKEKYIVAKEDYRNTYFQLDLLEILKKQNNTSRDKTTGFISVLNTCVFLVADYNFSLVE